MVSCSNPSCEAQSERVGWPTRQFAPYGTTYLLCNTALERLPTQSYYRLKGKRNASDYTHLNGENLGHPYRDLPLPDEDMKAQFDKKAKHALERMRKAQKFDVGGVVTAVQVGNSLLVVIPAPLVKAKGFKAGERFIGYANNFGLAYRRILGQEKELTKLFGEAKE